MSFQTGLSGLNASARNLDVIGHNIANANTIGMKASRAEFAEVYASSLGATGGSNAGIGVQVARVSQLFTQGTLKVTGNQLDLAINGSGFFAVRQFDDAGRPTSEPLFTRNGQFRLDRDGFLIAGNGMRLLGTDLRNVGGVDSPIQFPVGSGGNDARATSLIGINANLDSRLGVTDNPSWINASDGITIPSNLDFSSLTNASRTSLNVFDAEGTPARLDVFFVKIGTSIMPEATDPADPADPADPTDPTDPAISFRSSRWAIVGRIEGVDGPILLGDIRFGGDGQLDGENPPVLNSTTISASQTWPSQDLTFRLNPNEFKLSQFGSAFSVFDLRQDGYPEGRLTSIDIGEDGVITSRFSNGVSTPSFQIGLANFRNVQGLEPVNGGFWRATRDSGPAIDGVALSGSFGLIRQNALEESNVDLTQELVNMIVAQRSYQANAQTIKTQDQVLQTLVNLR